MSSLIAKELSNSHFSLFIWAKSLLSPKNWLKCINIFFLLLRNIWPNIFCLVAASQLPNASVVPPVVRLHSGVIFHGPLYMANPPFIDGDNILAAFQHHSLLFCLQSVAIPNRQSIFHGSIWVQILTFVKAQRGKSHSCKLFLLCPFKM